jgi:hypothetical protein
MYLARLRARRNPGPSFEREQIFRFRIYISVCCVGGAYAEHRLDAKDRALWR